MRGVRGEVVESEALRLFSTTHPQIFGKLVDRNTPARVLDNMFMMIGVRARIESGELDEDLALSASTVMSGCSVRSAEIL